MGAGEGDEPALGLEALRAGVGVAGGEDQQSGSAGGGSLGDERLHLVHGDRDHHELDLLADLGERGVGGEALHLPGGAVHGVHGAGEPALEDVAQHHGADGLGVAGGPDDGHGLRGHELGDAAGLGAVLAGLDHGAPAGGGVDGELDGHDAVLEAPGDLEAGLLEHGEHLAVLRQHLGGEPPDAVLAGGDRQVLHEDGAQAAALRGVGDVERDLGGVGVPVAVVPAHAEQAAAARDHERHPVLVVHVREPVQVLGAELGLVGEVAQVDRVLGLPGVHALQLVRVLRGDGAQTRRGAVAEDDVGLPVARIVADRFGVTHRIHPRQSPTP